MGLGLGSLYDLDVLWMPPCYIPCRLTNSAELSVMSCHLKLAEHCLRCADYLIKSKQDRIGHRQSSERRLK